MVLTLPEVDQRQHGNHLGFRVRDKGFAYLCADDLTMLVKASREDQAALIAVEQQNLGAHRAALEGARMMLAADDRVTGQRREQMWRRDVDDYMEKTRAAVGGW